LQAVTTRDRTLVLSDFADAFKTQIEMDRATGMIRGVSLPTSSF
jgi:hypothetical protein